MGFEDERMLPIVAIIIRSGIKRRYIKRDFFIL